jgi:uncharacterized membrane protein YjdF
VASVSAAWVRRYICDYQYDRCNRYVTGEEASFVARWILKRTSSRHDPGFPIVIALLIPFRILVIPRLHLFTEDELNILDGPVASPFTMQSVNVA